MVAKANNVINGAYKSFVPSAAELKRLDKIAARMIGYVRKSSWEHKINATASFGGSYAKGTSIRNKSDIDIFVSFDSEKETKLLGKLVPKNFSEQRGTRIYYRGKVNGVYVEIVPVVRFIKAEKVKNSIDLSVLHAGYVRNRLNDRLRNDIIVLKQFCKASGCYGSETFRHGFSGYSLELLVGHYGGILQLFKAVNKWKPLLLIDPGRHYKDKAAVLKVIRADSSPIVLVDPTNPKRNVCGSLNEENMAKFVFAVKKFLVSPSTDAFKERDLERIIQKRSIKRGTSLFEYSTHIHGPKDKFLSMYNKSLHKLLDELRKNGVEIYESTPVYHDKEVRLFLEISNTPVTRTHMVTGPQVWLDFESFSKYLKQHSDSYPFGETASYDKPYAIKNFKRFIEAKLKEYIASKAILKN